MIGTSGQSFELNHEPIINLETWERVQELRKQRKRPNRYDEVGLYSWLLFCADCGSVIFQQRYESEKRISELSAIFKRLYEDSVAGRITDEHFIELSADYEQEQAELKTRVSQLQDELAKAQDASVNAEKFMKIVVHECSYNENNNCRQDIEIYYSFVGKVDLPE